MLLAMVDLLEARFIVDNSRILRSQVLAGMKVLGAERKRLVAHQE